MSEPLTGVALQATDPPGRFRGMVAEIESLGYDHLWVTDSSLHARNCYVALTLAAVSSRHLAIGTAVTNPLTRHPAITAVAMASVDEVSGGRLICGLGAGDRPLLALGHHPARLADLEATVTALRALWSGSEVSMTTDAFALDAAHLRFASREDIPIFLSCSGPRTLELAGRVADGVILLVGLFPEAIAWALDHVDRGARSAGRARPHIAVFAYGAITDDRDIALTEGRSIAAWFPQTAPAICELAGISSELVEKVRASYSGGEFQEASEAVSLLPDAFVRKVALAGDREDARERIEAVLSSGVDSIHVFPLGADRMGTVRGFARAVREVVGDD